MRCLDLAKLVLVVDDDADVALVSQLHLEAAGFEVSVVGTGQDAVDFCRQSRPLSVVLDFMLPDLDGLQVVSLLKGDPATAGIPIVMLTARTDERDQRAAWGAGVTEFITKPFEGSRLVEAVRDSLKQTSDADSDDRRLKAIERLEAGDHESSRQLAAIIEGTDDAVIAKTLSGRIISWNSGAERLYGWTSGEAVGQSISMLAPPGLDDEIPAILQRIAAGERVPPYETLRLRRDGRAVLVSLTVSPIKDALGRVIGASAISRDVTERHRVEQRFRGLVEAAPDAIVIVGSNGLIELVNARPRICSDTHERTSSASPSSCSSRSATAIATRSTASSTPRIHAPGPWAPASTCSASEPTARSSRSRSR